MAISGWDVRPVALGDALYESRILDYDLVRQVRDEMNQQPVLPGLWDADFYGDSQHAGATYIMQAPTRAAALERLREDIQQFKVEHGVGGHVTVMWSASVERPCEEYASADDLLAAIERDDAPNVSPSLVYAVAAVLEGCSFVNDFKAGQTKAKTAIVEYLRALGLQPRTIASYNHLGNNDMKNLLSPRTWSAKARVKTDVFGAWQEDGHIDHKVAVLYTEQMGDEKRDTVEYTSEAFMGCEHTMLTYTRCMDSALCVPLMIDATVFCDYLAVRGASADDAAAALAYLFKVNEGAAAGVDPGFFNQSAALASVLEKLPSAPVSAAAADKDAIVAGAGDDAPSAPGGGQLEGGVLCAGLACLDMMLLRAAQPTSTEAIAPFSGCNVRAGGSAPNTAAALRALGARASILACTGDDLHGEELARQFDAAGIDTSMLLRRADVSTSLAVLPVFEVGGRGCWVDLSANDALTCDAVLDAMRVGAPTLRGVRAMHVGYPHLLSKLRGEALRAVLEGGASLIAQAQGDDQAADTDAAADVSATADARGGLPLTSVDVNGATLGAFADADGVLGAALPLIDMLHANLEEACHVVGIAPGSLDEATVSDDELRALVAPLLAGGVGVVAITLGAAGAYVAVTDDAERLRRGDGTLARATAAWRPGDTARLPALPLTGELNANGAGDAFTAGLLAAMLWRGASPLSLEAAVNVALGSARQRVDAGTTPRSIDAMVDGTALAA